MNRFLSIPEFVRLRRVVPPLLAGTVVALDLITKALVRSLPDSVALWGAVRIERFENLQGPFGSLSLSVVSVASVIVLLCLSLAYARSDRIADRVGLALILGGGVSNFLERSIASRTTDIFLLPGHSAWNIADVAILLGIVVLVVRWFRR